MTDTTAESTKPATAPGIPTPRAQVFIDGLADLMAHSARTPILRWPDEYGLEYEDVFFPAMDGVTLEGWFIPSDSDRLLICNHPMPCNRYGYPGHLEPWTDFGGFEVNFLPEYKILHDAGYNILTYDLRNHGRSGMGSGGIIGHGVLEYRDVIGSLRYANSRTDTKDMKTALYSRCLGANSTVVAMNKYPEEFRHILAMIALQPAAPRGFVEAALDRAGIADGRESFDEALHRRSGIASMTSRRSRTQGRSPSRHSSPRSTTTSRCLRPTCRRSTTTSPLKTRSSSGSKGRTFASRDTTTSENTRSWSWSGLTRTCHDTPGSLGPTARASRMADEEFKKALETSPEIELTVRGRTSGREISNPLWFVREGEKLYLVPVRGSDADWYKNVLKTPTIRLAAGGAQLSARASPISDAAKVDQVLDTFRARYGAQDVEAYYPKQDVAVEVPLA